MIPVGYMAKRIYNRPEWLGVPNVVDIYSVSSCISEDFADYTPFWKHNGYWLFDSPEVIRALAQEKSIRLDGTNLFFYEAHELEFDGEAWNRWLPKSSFLTNVVSAARRQLEGFDIVSFSARTSPECSPLSCNSVAKEIPTNQHCLVESFDEAEANINNGSFKNSEPGPYRIFSVYSVDWP